MTDVLPNAGKVWQSFAILVAVTPSGARSPPFLPPADSREVITLSAADPAPSRRALVRSPWVVLGVAVVIYVFAVMHRTTLGVAGLDAAERFQISPGTLALFAFIQVAVYAAAQVPAGLFVDRYGARTMLLISCALLGMGQLALALVTNLPLAIAARVLVGVGDAIVFVGVVALIPRWFPPGRVPMTTQVALIFGQLGQVLSALPFAALLHGAGWSTAFGVAAATALVGAVLVLAFVGNSPDGWLPAPMASLREVGRQVAQVWRRPGTRLGFFGHMGTQFSMMVFVVLWGVPYLVSGQGRTTGEAAGLVTAFVIATIVIGPVVGYLTKRFPMRRSWILLGIIAANATIWTAVLLTPAPAPLWMLVVLVLVLAADGPASVVGFDIARTTNPSRNVAVAQSMVNVGGFLASLVVLAAMGTVLTALGGFSPDAFRIAWLVQYPIWLFAVIAILVTRRKARRVDAARGVVPRPLREVFASALRR